MAAQGSSLRFMCQRDLVAAVGSIPVPSFAFEVPTTLFIAANAKFEALLGYSMAELCRMKAESIRPAEDLPKFRRKLTDETPQGFVEARYITRNGGVLAAKIHHHLFECLKEDGTSVR